MDRGVPVDLRIDRSGSRPEPGARAISDRDSRRKRPQTDFTSRIARENDELTARLYHLTPLLTGLATELATVRREYARLKRDHETLRAELNAPPRPDHTAAGE